MALRELAQPFIDAFTPKDEPLFIKQPVPKAYEQGVESFIRGAPKIAEGIQAGLAAIDPGTYAEAGIRRLFPQSSATNVLAPLVGLGVSLIGTSMSALLLKYPCRGRSIARMTTGARIRQSVNGMRWIMTGGCGRIGN